MNKFSELKKVLEGKTSFALFAHEDPDGDAIGAILAFGKYLSDKKKEVKLISKDDLPAFFSFLNADHLIERDFLAGDYDVFVLIDNGDLKRTGFADRIVRAKKKGKIIINIDHHIQNDIWKIADVNLAFPEYSSTCEIVYEILTEDNYFIDSKVATNLLAGIYYDTGGFQHSNTSQKVLRIVAELLQRGARLRKISNNVSQARSLAMLKLWGIALDRITVLDDYNLAYSVLTQQDIVLSGATEEEISGLVNLINTTAEAEASLLICETNNGKIKGSLRTESDKIDLAALAKILGGGGHKKAAGFLLDGKIVKNRDGWEIK